LPQGRNDGFEGSLYEPGIGWPGQQKPFRCDTRPFDQSARIAAARLRLSRRLVCMLNIAATHFERRPTQKHHAGARMAKRGTAAAIALGDELDIIKKAALVAMFADDDLMELLVLKGGNAIDLVHQVNSRASVDLDFSIPGDLDHELVRPKIEHALQSTFELQGYHAFDIKMSSRPGQMPDELASFWGGYLVEFKLISRDRARATEKSLETMRREAIRLGEGTKFTIDISRHEYVDGKQAHDLDGYRIYVYSPEMIVCEKLRAICQQLPEYASIVSRGGLSNQRARDFIDIEALVERFNVDLSAEQAHQVVGHMFAAKKVPLRFLGLIAATRDFHQLGYAQVKAAMKPGVRVQPFDHYFSFVLEQCKKLEPLWNI
jgi:Nucleotidyl transferase AbiEii toxin, Type IV TA system